MSLLGRAALAVWNDITPAVRHQFHAWHSQHHLPEKFRQSGFLRARRFAALDDGPHYFSFYEVDDVATLRAPPAPPAPAPSELEAQLEPHFSLVDRMVCQGQASSGAAGCGLVCTLRGAARPELPKVDNGPLNGCHLLLDDERYLLILESWGDVDAFSEACRVVAAKINADANIYRLQFESRNP